MKLNRINKKITSLLFSILMITSVFAGFVMPVMATNEGMVSGKVLCYKGNPVDGASIDIWDQETGNWSGWAETDADGNYIITGLVAGTYEMSVYPPFGVYLASAFITDIMVTVGEITIVNVTLMPLLPPTNINIVPNTASLDVGKIIRFTITTYPWDADQRVTWNVNNATVGTIDTNGIFEAKVVGATTVTATSVVDPNITANATISVIPPGVLHLSWRYSLQPGVDRMQFGASPAIADLDINIIRGEPNLDLEIVTGSCELDNFYPELNATAFGIWRTFDSQGNIEWVRDTLTDEARSSVAIVDIDEDGFLEIAGGTTSGWNVQVMDRYGNFIWTFPYPPQTGGPFMWHSSPAVAEIDPNVSGLELVIGNNPNTSVWAFDGDNSDEVDDGITLDTTIYPWANGTEGIDWDVLWIFTTDGSVISSPAIGDIDNDRDLDVVFGCGWDDGEMPGGSIYALDGRTGKLLYVFQTGGTAVDASAALADFDGDGDLEVVIGSNDSRVYFIDGDENADGIINIDEIIYFQTGDSVHSSAAVGDLDLDGLLEIVVGSNDGKVYSFRYDPVTNTVNKLWTFPTLGAVYSSPALASRDDDGTLDIYIGSVDGYLYLIDGPTGSLIDKFYTNASIRTSPSVADVDGDGMLDIFFTSWNSDYPTMGAIGDIFWSLKDTGSKSHPYAMDWSVFRQNTYRTGTVVVPVIVPPAPTAITISPATATLNVTETRQFTATVSPAGADQRVTWSVFNATVGTINATGFFTARSAGTTNVTARSVVDANITGNTTVTVVLPIVILPVPTAINITPATTTRNVTETQQFSATVLPAGADQRVTWSVINVTVGTITADGLFTARSAGTVTVTARSVVAPGIAGNVTVTVVAPVRRRVVDLSIQPPTTSVREGETFTLEIRAAAGVQEVTGISAFLDFNSTYLQVVSIAPGAAIPTVMLNRFNNTIGTVDYSAGDIIAPFPTGTFTVANITFRAIRTTSVTAIEFNRTLPRQTIADFGGTDVTGSITGTRVTVTLLVPGDADGNGRVNIADFGILAASFGRSRGEAGFDSRADFNGDGIVNIADFGILAANFGR